MKPVMASPRHADSSNARCQSCSGMASSPSGIWRALFVVVERLVFGDELAYRASMPSRNASATAVRRDAVCATAADIDLVLLHHGAGTIGASVSSTRVIHATHPAASAAAAILRS